MMRDIVNEYWQYVQPDGTLFGPRFETLAWAEMITPMYKAADACGAVLHRFTTTKQPEIGFAPTWKENDT